MASSTQGQGRGAKNLAAPGEASEAPDQVSAEDELVGDAEEGAEDSYDLEEGHLEGAEEEAHVEGDFEGEMEGVEEGGQEQFVDLEEGETEHNEEDACAGEGGDPGGEELAGDGADNEGDVKRGEAKDDDVSHDISWVEELWNLKKAEEAAKAKRKKAESERQKSENPDVEMDDSEMVVATDKEKAKDVEESEVQKTSLVEEKEDPDHENAQEETSAEDQTTDVKEKIAKTPFSIMKSMVTIPAAYFGPAFDENSFQFCVRVSPMVYKDFHLNDWRAVIHNADCVNLKLRRQGYDRSPRMAELYSQNPAGLMQDLMFFNNYSLQHVNVEIVMRSATEWKDVSTDDNKRIHVPLGFCPDNAIKAVIRWNNVYARSRLRQHINMSVQVDQPVKERSLFINNIPSAVTQRMLKIMFPLCSRMTVVNVSESQRSAVLTLRSRRMVVDHLIAYHAVNINGKKLELGATNMSQADAFKEVEKLPEGWRFLPHSKRPRSRKHGTTTTTKAETGTSEKSDYEEQKIKDSERNERIKKAQERSQNRQRERRGKENPKLTERGRAVKDTRPGSLRSRGTARGRGRNLPETRVRQRRGSKQLRMQPERERQMQRDMEMFEREMHEIEKQRQMHVQREIEMQEELERQRERERQMEREMHQERDRRNWERNQQEQWEERERRKFERIRQQEEEDERQRYREMIRESEQMKKMHEEAIHKLKALEDQQRQEREDMERLKREIELERVRLQQENKEQEQRRQRQQKEEQELSRKRGRAEEGSRPGTGGWQHRGPNKRGKGDKGEWNKYDQSDSERLGRQGLQERHNERSAGHSSATAGPESEESVRHILEQEVQRQAEELKKSLALLDKIQKDPSSTDADKTGYQQEKTGYNKRSYGQGYQQKLGFNKESFGQGYQQQTYGAEFKQPQTYSSLSQNQGYDIQTQGYGQDQTQGYGQDYIQGYGEGQTQGYGKDHMKGYGQGQVQDYGHEKTQFSYKQEGVHRQSSETGNIYSKWYEVQDSAQSGNGGWYGMQDQIQSQTLSWGVGAQEVGGWPQKDKSSTSTRVYVRGQGRNQNAKKRERARDGGGARYGQKGRGSGGGSGGQGAGRSGDRGGGYQSKGSYY